MRAKERVSQNPLHTFPCNFPIDEEAANFLQTCYRFVQTCCGLVSDTANKSVTSCCNGIWEMTWHNRLFPAPSCYGLVVYGADLWWACYEEVANLLLTCYRETGAVDFGLYQITIMYAASVDFDAALCAGSVLCLLFLYSKLRTQ